jgi:selenocysteine lyase/cysteine desulfurase
MLEDKQGLMDEVRARFAHVDYCPVQGKRIFFENAGGALSLRSVVDTSARFAAIPDNQGRSNQMSQGLGEVISAAKTGAMTLFGATQGQIFAGESGTELLFRLISTAIIESDPGGDVIGSTLEHPASRSAAVRWAKIAQKRYIEVPHDDATGSVEAGDYAKHVTPQTRVATIVHTSPVTGMAVDVAAVSAAIRKVAPECFIIIDGIQHAAHGRLSMSDYGADGYVISPYKMFSRHGYGLAWISPRFEALPHDTLIDGPQTNWELGTRDTGAYATFADVVAYFDWLGGHFSDGDLRRRIEAAGAAIHEHEKSLTDAMLNGTGNQPGLARYDSVRIVGGVDNPRREGLVAFWVDGQSSAEIIEALNGRDIRTHIRKADHYSGNILKPLGREDCIRVSMCHYNTTGEVAAFLSAMREILTA